MADKDDLPPLRGEFKIHGTSTGRFRSSSISKGKSPKKAVDDWVYRIKFSVDLVTYRPVKELKPEGIIVDYDGSKFRVILEGPWQGVYGRPYWHFDTAVTAYEVGKALADHLGVAAKYSDAGMLVDLETYQAGYKMNK